MADCVFAALAVALVEEVYFVVEYDGGGGGEAFAVGAVAGEEVADFFPCCEVGAFGDADGEAFIGAHGVVHVICAGELYDVGVLGEGAAVCVVGVVHLGFVECEAWGGERGDADEETCFLFECFWVIHFCLVCSRNLEG